jgi:hypothetical protein
MKKNFRNRKKIEKNARWKAESELSVFATTLLMMISYFLENDRRSFDSQLIGKE